MEELEPVAEFGPEHTHERRALALIAGSIITIAATGVLYLHPSLPFMAGDAIPGAPALQAAYRITAVDFVDPLSGWVVADFSSGDFAILHTSDGGLSWSHQLAGSTDGHPQYMKFFDSAVGVFAQIGTAPVVHRTADGGRTWTSLPALKVAGTVVSWSFVDSDQGWMLVRAPSPAVAAPTFLFHTDDGGFSWTDLGQPAAAPDHAYQVNFSYFTTGWLTTASSGPYAYKTQDFGQTWSRVQLPAPPDGWPRGGQFFVAVQPTSGGGAVASVVYFPAIKGRTGIGADIHGFPPLLVRGFDGGRPHTYTYSTVIDQLVVGPFAQDQPPNQTELSTVDNGINWSAIEPPSSTGAIGCFDASDCWWIGGGQWATSQDGGATWTDPRNIATVESLPGSLQVLDKNHAWFAGSAGPRPVLEATGDGGRVWRMVLLPPMPDLTTP